MDTIKRHEIWVFYASVLFFVTIKGVALGWAVWFFYIGSNAPGVALMLFVLLVRLKARYSPDDPQRPEAEFKAEI